jgi:hypothetical protein
MPHFDGATQNSRRRRGKDCFIFNVGAEVERGRCGLHTRVDGDVPVRTEDGRGARDGDVQAEGVQYRDSLHGKRWCVREREATLEACRTLPGPLGTVRRRRNKSRNFDFCTDRGPTSGAAEATERPELHGLRLVKVRFRRETANKLEPECAWV